MGNAAMMAGGSMPPQGNPQAGGQPPVQVTPGQVTGGDPEKIKEALKTAIQQCVDQRGFVDMNKLIQLWPQVSQQMGINIPFATVLQMIQEDPSLVEDIINQMGLAGIIVNGKMISAEELLNQGQSGASAATGSPAVGQAAPPMPPQGGMAPGGV